MIRVFLAFVILNLTGMLIFSGYLYRQDEVFQTYGEIEQSVDEYWDILNKPESWPRSLPVMFSKVESTGQGQVFEVTDQWGRHDSLRVSLNSEDHIIRVQGTLHNWRLQLVPNAKNPEHSTLLFYDVWPDSSGPLDWFMYKLTLNNGLSRVNL